MENNILYLGIASGLCTGIASVPQLIKLLKTKKADDLSFVMLAVLVVGLLGWTWYGIIKNDLPLIFTNGFGAINNLLILGFGMYYRKAKS